MSSSQKESVVCGAVTLKDHASVWFNAVLRADMNEMTIGCHTNIQDNAVFHVSLDAPLELGDYVTIGHGAILHGCKVGDNCLIGMGSILLDHVESSPLLHDWCRLPSSHPSSKHPPTASLSVLPQKLSASLNPRKLNSLNFGPSSIPLWLSITFQTRFPSVRLARILRIMNISIILAHPNPESFNHAIAQTLCRAIRAQGAHSLCCTISTPKILTPSHSLAELARVPDALPPLVQKAYRRNLRC